jgi:hypothetical protein
LNVIADLEKKTN